MVVPVLIHQLPCVRPLEKRAGGTPDKDDQHGQQESPGPAGRGRHSGGGSLKPNDHHSIPLRQWSKLSLH